MINLNFKEQWPGKQQQNRQAYVTLVFDTTTLTLVRIGHILNMFRI